MGEPIAPRPIKPIFAASILPIVLYNLVDRSDWRRKCLDANVSWIGNDSYVRMRPKVVCRIYESVDKDAGNTDAKKICQGSSEGPSGECGSRARQSLKGYPKTPTAVGCTGVLCPHKDSPWSSVGVCLPQPCGARPLPGQGVHRLVQHWGNCKFLPLCDGHLQETMASLSASRSPRRGSHAIGECHLSIVGSARKSDPHCGCSFGGHTSVPCIRTCRRAVPQP